MTAGVPVFACGHVRVPGVTSLVSLTERELEIYVDHGLSATLRHACAEELNDRLARCPRCVRERSRRNSWISGVAVAVAAALALLVTCSARADEFELCRDYVPHPAEECLYPTELINVQGLPVCRCPRSQPCGVAP